MNATANRPSEASAPGAAIVDMILTEAARGAVSYQTLRGGIGVITGSGGNIGVCVGPDGTLFIDAGIAISRGKIWDALSSAGASTVAQLVNTHWHFDHTGGNEWLHSEGATIVAHENTRKRLAQATRVEGWRRTFPASPAGALPAMVFDQKHLIEFNRQTILLEYFGPAHTDSDVFAYFAEDDVLFVGDIWWNGVYPFIDYSTGGSIDGTIRACEKVLGTATDITLIVPGHGPAAGVRELTEFRDMLILMRDRVARLKQKGLSVDETIAAKPTADYDARWGSLVPPGLFTEVIYATV